MRKTIFGCLGAAAVAFALQFTPANVEAGLFSPCDPNGCDPCGEVVCTPCDNLWDCDPCGALNGCGPSLGKWFLNGHIDTGFWANAHGKKSTYGDADNPLTYARGADLFSGNTGYLQNTRLTGAQINQLYVSMGRSVDGRRGLDIGGTVDFTWGSDAYIVQAAGLEHSTGRASSWGSGDYFSAFAQAYAELAYGRWNVKAGKFYAPFGIDSYKSTENFFYSWSPTNLIAPTVAGGAYATFKASDRLTLIGGWVMPEEIGESSKYNTFAGGFIWTPGKKLNLRYTFAAGKNKYEGNALDTPYDVFVQSLTTTYQYNKRISYVFDWTLLNVNSDGESLASSYSLMNEIIFKYNSRWSFGQRFGMISGNYLDPAGAILGGEGVDLYTVSLGANWTPNKWLTVKPEIRYDWNEDGLALFGAGEKTYQFSGGLSTVVKF